MTTEIVLSNPIDTRIAEWLAVKTNKTHSQRTATIYRETMADFRAVLALRETPECQAWSKGAGQWQDPTHISAWCPNSLGYYEDGHACRERFGAACGIVARFKVISCVERDYQYPHQDRERVWKFAAILEAVK